MGILDDSFGNLLELADDLAWTAAVRADDSVQYMGDLADNYLELRKEQQCESEPA